MAFALFIYLFGLVILHVIFYVAIVPFHHKIAKKLGKKYDPKTNSYY